MLVGVGGSGKQSLTKLTSFVCKCTLFGIQLTGTYNEGNLKEDMLALYNQVMDLESQRARSGILKSMRNRVVKTGSKHFDQEILNQRLQAAGWDGLKDKEIAFFYG